MKRKRIIRKLIKKIILSFKKYFGEIVTGVVIGLIVLILTPLVNNIINEKLYKHELADNLSSVSLGMSKNYIDELFGQPIIENEYQDVVRWYSDHSTEETFISAGYKLKNSVLLCLYCRKSLVAFVVAVNETNLYRIPSNMYIGECCLLDFTYYDFSPDATVFEGNVPSNNDVYAYYTELYDGAGPADYNYFLIGSYRDYREESCADTLMLIGQDYAWDNTFHYYNEEQHNTARKNTQPNVFGIVSSTFSDEFNFVMDIIGDRTNGTLLFQDWYE